MLLRPNRSDLKRSREKKRRSRRVLLPRLRRQDWPSSKDKRKKMPVLKPKLSRKDSRN